MCQCLVTGRSNIWTTKYDNPLRNLPKSGEAMVVPWVNKDIMIEHLKQISAVTEKGGHAIVVMDGAGWHTKGIAEEFNNVSVIKLPSIH